MPNTPLQLWENCVKRSWRVAIWSEGCFFLLAAQAVMGPFFWIAGTAACPSKTAEESCYVFLMRCNCNHVWIYDWSEVWNLSSLFWRYFQVGVARYISESLQFFQAVEPSERAMKFSLAEVTGCYVIHQSLQDPKVFFQQISELAVGHAAKMLYRLGRVTRRGVAVYKSKNML